MSPTEESREPRVVDAGRLLASGAAPRPDARANIQLAVAWAAAVALPLGGAHLWPDTGDPTGALVGLVAVLVAAFLGGLGPGLLATALATSNLLAPFTPASLLALPPERVIRALMLGVTGVGIAALAHRVRMYRRLASELSAQLARERLEGRRREIEAHRLAEAADALRRRTSEIEDDLRLARARARPVHALGPGTPAAPRVRRVIVPMFLFPPTTSDWLG